MNRRIKELKTRYKKYRKLNKNYRKTPVEPWAFIRVKNEIKTIKACLESIIPVIKKGVIGYHKLAENENDDGTEEYIIKFCNENSGYVLYKYENEVITADDDRYKELSKIPIKNRLDSYYNSVLEQIPKGEWIIKIDCDHVYDTEKIRRCMYLPKEDNDVISFARFNLHYDDKKLYVIKKDSFYDVGDHWLLKNNGLYFKFCSGIKNNKFYAWEQLVIPEGRKIYNTGLFNWHFPFIKSSRTILKKDLIEFSKFKVSLYDKLYYHIKKDMINQERIEEICKKFNKDTND